MQAFLMTGQRRYHIASESWIRDGKGVCGADISKPGFSPLTIGEPMSYRCTGETKFRRATLCAKCARLSAHSARSP